jgi:3-oxoacyl-[acyl-carrier protein] reductase
VLDDVATFVVSGALSNRACGGVVAAAGGLSPSPEAGSELERVRADWYRSFDSNVLTAVLLVEALRPALERDGGRVVLLSSVAALRGSGGGPYGAMKAALHAWAYDLAADLGPAGGTANVVAPGFVPDTEFWAGRLTEQSAERRAAQTLLGRGGTPHEVASLVTWLLGPDGGWVTGQVLSPNGGVVLGR